MIAYVCYDCAKTLKLPSSLPAENEVGRKACSRCGYNGTIYIVDLNDFEKAMKK